MRVLIYSEPSLRSQASAWSRPGLSLNLSSLSRARAFSFRLGSISLAKKHSRLIEPIKLERFYSLKSSIRLWKIRLDRARALVLSTLSLEVGSNFELEQKLGPTLARTKTFMVNLILKIFALRVFQLCARSKFQKNCTLLKIKFKMNFVECSKNKKFLSRHSLKSAWKWLMCQFHQHFTQAFFEQKCFAQLFSNYSLPLWLLANGSQRKSCS